LARLLPVAEDITVESDSGGHTDNRPLGSLFPTITQLRDDLVARHGYTRPIRVGAAGGLGTPEAVAGAFAMGAAYVLTGSVNQSCIEAGVSADAKALLAVAELADMTMAPSADMFELGVKVQVLKRGTMFASRAATLYNLYTRFPSLDAIPADELARLEQQLFRQPVGEVWEDARKFFEVRGPHENERAARDPKHKMALVFRSYLGAPAAGPSTATPTAASTTRSGAGRPWARSTPGSKAPSWNNRKTARSSRSRATCWKAPPTSPAPHSCAATARRFPRRPSPSARDHCSRLGFTVKVLRRLPAAPKRWTVYLLLFGSVAAPKPQAKN
jgi:hypothetical protein